VFSTLHDSSEPHITARVVGDADGDGDPSHSSAQLLANGGQDMPQLANSEAIVLRLDLGSPTGSAPDNIVDVAIGVPGEFAVNAGPASCVNLDMDCFGIYRSEDYVQGRVVYVANDTLYSKGVDYFVTNGNTNPREGAGDIQFIIEHFSELRQVAPGAAVPPPALTPFTTFDVAFSVFSGSFQDDGWCFLSFFSFIFGSR
jgi:hypothetical protein